MRKKNTLVFATVLLIMGLFNPSRQPFRLAVYYYSSLGACLASPCLLCRRPRPSLVLWGGWVSLSSIPFFSPSSSLSYGPGRPLPIPPPPRQGREEGTGEGEKAGWVARKRKNGFNFWRTHKGRGGVEKGDLFSLPNRFSSSRHKMNRLWPQLFPPPFSCSEDMEGGGGEEEVSRGLGL